MQATNVAISQFRLRSRILEHNSRLSVRSLPYTVVVLRLGHIPPACGLGEKRLPPLGYLLAFTDILLRNHTYLSSQTYICGFHGSFMRRMITSWELYTMIRQYTHGILYISFFNFSYIYTYVYTRNIHLKRLPDMCFKLSLVLI